MKLLNKATGVFDSTINALAFLAAALIVFIMLIVNVEVIMRMLIGKSMIYMEELSEFALVYITFLGAAWLLRREGHVKMDIVLQRLTPRLQTLANIINSVFGAVVCMLITWFSAWRTWDFFLSGYFLSAPLKPPFFIIIGIIPIGFFLLFIQFLRRTYRYSKGWNATSDYGSSERRLL